MDSKDLGERLEALIESTSVPKHQFTKKSCSKTGNSVNEQIANLKRGGGVVLSELDWMAEKLEVNPVCLYDSQNEIIPRYPNTTTAEYILFSIMEQADEQKLSRRELAEYSGVNKQHISSLFNRVYFPYTTTVEKLAKAVGIRIEYLTEENPALVI